VDQTTQVNVDANVDGQQAQTTQNQTTQASNEKMFSQEELNAIVTKRLAQLEKKYQGVDVTEYQQLKEVQAAQETEAALKRQEFDKVLVQVKTAAEQKITALQRELETIKIDGALIAEASSRKAVAPDKVAALLRSQLKLTNEGLVEVLDSQGQVRYKCRPGGQH
jgi:DNA polymerase elongation subunit (family B)